MIQFINSTDRGLAEHGWLKSRHTFSFADYHNPERMGFRALRVINEDWIAPRKGFPMHPHRDMEIITYVMSGGVRHEDSMGNKGVIEAGRLQRMTAGTGVVHSEANSSATDTLHLYQIWLLPDRAGHAPEYQEVTLGDEAKVPNRWHALAAAEGGAPMRIHADAKLLLARVEDGKNARYEFAPGRYGWLQLTRGEADAHGHQMTAGDALQISGDRSVELTAGEEGAEALLFDLG